MGHAYVERNFGDYELRESPTILDPDNFTPFKRIEIRYPVMYRVAGELIHETSPEAQVGELLRYIKIRLLKNNAEDKNTRIESAPERNNVPSVLDSVEIIL